MLELLYRIFIGHNHKWEIIREVGIIDDGGNRVGTKYHLQCEICGNIKYIKG